MAKKQAKTEVTLFWFLLFCIGAPVLIVNIYQWRGGGMSPSEARMAMYAGIFVTVILNLMLIAKGEYKLVLKHSKGYDPRQAAKHDVAPIRNDGDGSPPYRILKDPATGAETLYEWNEKTGQWESSDGLSILNEDGLEDWYKQRLKDKDWQDKESKKIREGNTAFDRDLRRMKEEADREIARMEKESKEMWDHYKRYGTWETDPEKLKAILKNRQELADIQGQMAAREGNFYAGVEFGLTCLSKICDYGVDILSEFTGSLGKYGIKPLYIAGRNFGYRWTEAVNEGRDMADAMRQATGDTVVDLTQSYAPDGYKYYANVGGDMYKKAMENAHEGKDLTDGLFTAGLGGAVRTKTESVLGGKFTSLYKGTAKSGAQNSVRYLEYVSKGDVSQKVYKTLLTNNRAATTQNLKLIKGGGTLANDVTQDIIQKLFG